MSDSLPSVSLPAVSLPAGSPPAESAGPSRFAGLIEQAKTLQARTVAFRRDVHRHPELGLTLPRTQERVLAELADLPLEVHRGTTTGSVTAVLRGGRPGSAVLLRGDMDALPMSEDSGVEFSSTVPGAMHSCGHDTHVAMLASAARLLAAHADHLAGSVVFMFQPGEEGFHGARYMLEDGLLDVAGAPVRSALALHVHGGGTSGKVMTRPGPMMAAADRFDVRVFGRGGHGSAPHQTLDPIPAAAEMVGALQTSLARRLSAFDTAVLSVCRISAGTASNVIPEMAELEGTMRTLSEATRDLVHGELVRVCEGVGAAHGCRVEVDIEPGYPATMNDPDVAEGVLALASELFGDKYSERMDEPILGAEDFAYVLQRVPGALAFLGACPPEVDLDTAPPNHSNRVVFHEDAMVHGVAMYAAFALDALG